MMKEGQVSMDSVGSQETCARTSLATSRQLLLSLGDRVNSYRVCSQNTRKPTFPNKDQMSKIGITMGAPLIATFVFIFVVVNVVMEKREPGWRDYDSTMPACSSDNHANYRLAGTNPVQHLSVQEFKVCLALFVAATIIQGGLGLELLVWIAFLKKGWTKETEKAWMFAQFFFPMVVTAAIGMSTHQNYAAIIVLVPGVWKGGLPETVMYFCSSMYNNEPDRKFIARVADFLNGLGTAVHHSSVALCVSLFLTGVAPPTPATLMCVMPPLMQHWFALLQCCNSTLCMVVVLTIEVWFEWTIFSTFHEIAMSHWSMALCPAALLVAHWIYLVAGALELYTGKNGRDKTSPQCLLHQETVSIDQEYDETGVCSGSGKHDVTFLDIDV